MFAVAFDPTGRVLATAGKDRTVVLWDVADPLHPRQWGAPLVGHDGTVVTVAFSPDGKTLATGGWDNRVILWDMSDPARPQRLPQPIAEHTNWVIDAASLPVVGSSRPRARTTPSACGTSAIRASRGASGNR